MLGDVIISLDAQATHHMRDLLGLLAGERVGSTVMVRIVRAGKTEERQIKIGERP
jgi:S1-C subfamily serine protease